jgi:hypothetical protein
MLLTFDLYFRPSPPEGPHMNDDDREYGEDHDDTEDREDDNDGFAR